MSRGLGDVYKRQPVLFSPFPSPMSESLPNENYAFLLKHTSFWNDVFPNATKPAFFPS